MSNIEKWKSQIERWNLSGLSKKEYCRKNKIPATTFDYWRKRVREETPGNADTLVKLPISLKSHFMDFKLEISRELILHIPDNYNKDKLLCLIRDLRELSQ
jgi:hypothetical protein